MEKCFKNAFYKNLWNTRGQEPFLILCTRTWQRQPAWGLASLFCVSEVGSIASDPAENFSPRVFSILLDSSPSDCTQSPRVGPKVSPFYIAENVVSEKCISIFQFWVRILGGFRVSGRASWSIASEHLRFTDSDGRMHALPVRFLVVGRPLLVTRGCCCLCSFCSGFNSVIRLEPPLSEIQFSFT